MIPVHVIVYRDGPPPLWWAAKNYRTYEAARDAEVGLRQQVALAYPNAVIETTDRPSHGCEVGCGIDAAAWGLGIDRDNLTCRRKR